MTDPLAHICSGWCNHPDVPTVIVTLAYLDSLRAAGVTLAPAEGLDVENARLRSLVMVYEPVYKAIVAAGSSDPGIAALIDLARGAADHD